MLFQIYQWFYGINHNIFLIGSNKHFVFYDRMISTENQATFFPDFSIQRIVECINAIS
jgi:hypothetical protein